MKFKPQAPLINGRKKSSKKFIKHIEILKANLKAKILLAQA